MNEKYIDAFRRLTYVTAIIIFMKKNGDFRVMLGTRNLRTVEMKYGFQGASLNGHDNRCNIKNGNIAVIDLMLGEARSFSIDRLAEIKYFGEIRKPDELDNIIDEFTRFEQQYNDKKLSMDMLD